MMNKALATLAVALLCTVGAQAQTDKMSSAPTSDKHSCLMADDNVWTSLGLTADQKQKVKDIQAKCKAEGEKKTMDAKSDATSAHEKELQAVLTPEQYDKWTKWCADQHAAGKGTMDKK